MVIGVSCDDACAIAAPLSLRRLARTLLRATEELLGERLVDRLMAGEARGQAESLRDIMPAFEDVHHPEETTDHALRALLLAFDTGPRRIRAPGARGGRRRLRRRGAHAAARARRAGADAPAGRQGRGTRAVRAALPQGGKAMHRPDGEHSAVPRASARPRDGR